MVRNTKQDEKSRKERKLKRDKAKRAKDDNFPVGAEVLKTQKKTTFKPPFNPKPYKVMKSEGPCVTMEYGGEVLGRNKPS